MTQASLVSCLCITRQRVPMLRRAVACFMAQTHPARELLIVFESDDAATRDHVAALAGPMIRAIEVPARPKLTLGALRNIAIAAAHGEYVAQWDDDDWYAPGRLAEQLRAALASQQPACALARWTMFDEHTQQAFVSAHRAWEGSLLCLRRVMPPYPDLARAEDTALVAELLHNKQLIGLDRPQLYIYVVHGRNTWERSHWENNMRAHARPLSPVQTAKVRQLLAL